MKKMEERRKNKKFKKKENKKYPYKQKPKVVISEETKTKLDKLGTKGDTYDDVIGGLLAGPYKQNKEIKKCQKEK